MSYNYKEGILVPFVQKFYKQMIVVVAGLFIASMAAMTFNVSAAPVVLAGCDFDDDLSGTWTLQSDCYSDEQIDVPSDTTLDGNGNTIYADFSKTTNSNNAVLGVIGADNVTIQNLTIDGDGGTDLHGINSYLSQNVLIENVTVLNNDHSALVVNGSSVTINNFSTEGNSSFIANIPGYGDAYWSVIDVSQGGGVVEPSVLTIIGISRHAENIPGQTNILVSSNSNPDLIVNDTMSQYKFVDAFGARFYTLKVVLGSKNECKKGGWMTSENPVFKNQGECVSSFAKVTNNGRNN